jgi:hypothetical protein
VYGDIYNFPWSFAICKIEERTLILVIRHFEILIREYRYYYRNKHFQHNRESYNVLSFVLIAVNER